MLSNLKINDELKICQYLSGEKERSGIVKEYNEPDPMVNYSIHIVDVDHFYNRDLFPDSV